MNVQGGLGGRWGENLRDFAKGVSSLPSEGSQEAPTITAFESSATITHKRMPVGGNEMCGEPGSEVLDGGGGVDHLVK